MNDLSDAEARHRILTEFERTFFVEAAAGTGKTTALVGRIVGLVQSGAGKLSQMVAVTFTDKAAGEMKLRLRSEIERARANATTEERHRFEDALEELELAHIGTIHSFCDDLLRERPVEAKIDPLFALAAEDATKALADEAFESWFQRILANPPEGIRRILRRRSRGDAPREILKAAFQHLRDHRDFPTLWRRPSFDRNVSIDVMMTDLQAIGSIAASSSWPKENLSQNLFHIANFTEEITRRDAVQERDYDGLESELRELARHNSWKRKGSQKVSFGHLSRDAALCLRDEAKNKLDVLVANCEADLAPLIHEAMQGVVSDFEVLKARSGQLDFLDLLIKARDLIRDNADVRAELQHRFTHFFIDEFQDTDPLQVEIMLLLAADDPKASDWRTAHPTAGKLFLVGDPKQSIYRFRRADVALYEAVKHRLLDLGAELLKLTTSFRALPSIQSFINGAFAPVMPSASDGSQAEYVPLDRFRPDIEGRPTIVALPVPRPYGDFGKIVQRRIEESYPEAVGAFIDWLINESKWTVKEGRQIVPVGARHVAILSRRFRNFGSDAMRPYVRALEARNVPHVLVGGRSFHDREEIIALRNALVAIEWPDDELRVFATLRGPFFAISDEALLAYRQFIGIDGSLQSRRLAPMRLTDAEELAPVAREVPEALALLARLHVERNGRPIAQTINLLLEALRAHAGTALWPNGEQALANCQRLIDMARHFEHSASSFRAFVEKLEAGAEDGEADEAPIVEEGTEGVRIMTVHKAKGLEFPVVILADPTCNVAWNKPSRHVDSARHIWLETVCGCSPIELIEAAEEELKRDKDEAVRLAYVAATRAQDLLVVPVCGDQPIEGWLEVFDPMLYPPNSVRRKSEAAPGCPAFGDESVVDRGPKGSAPPAGAVKPGLHRPTAEGPSIIWWDPTALKLEVEEGGTLRHQRILEADPEGTAAAASERNYLAWVAAKKELAMKASQPSLSVQTITAAAREEAEAIVGEINRADGEQPIAPTAQITVLVERVERVDCDRPAGRRFGTLVHTVLATIDLDADGAAIVASAVINGRLVGAGENEVAAAAQAVGAALKHPIMRRAAATSSTGGLRRETPVMLKRADGTQIEGVIDLAFREATSEFTGWTVVDFKTDREFDPMSRQYASQVRLYSEAVAAATGAPARGFLLVV